MNGLIAVVDGADCYNWRRLASQFAAIYVVPIEENDGWDEALANEVEDALITSRAHGAKAQAGDGELTELSFTLAVRWLTHGGGAELTEIRAPRRLHDVVRPALQRAVIAAPLLQPGGTPADR